MKKSKKILIEKYVNLRCKQIQEQQVAGMWNQPLVPKLKPGDEGYIAPLTADQINQNVKNYLTGGQSLDDRLGRVTGFLDKLSYIPHPYAMMGGVAGGLVDTARSYDAFGKTDRSPEEQQDLATSGGMNALLSMGPGAKLFKKPIKTAINPLIKNLSKGTQDASTHVVKTGAKDVLKPDGSGGTASKAIIAPSKRVKKYT